MRKNKWNWMAALLMIVVGMSSCSSEEELEVEVDEPLSVNQALFSSDTYDIGYSLRNERGDRTTTFKEGENIIFDVTILNGTGYEIRLGEEREILWSAASVFRSDGEFVGNPTFTNNWTSEYRSFAIEAHGRHHWYCAWLGGFSPLNPLPKGTYYSMLKARVSYRIHDDSTSGGGTKGNDDIELRIPFTVE